MTEKPIFKATDKFIVRGKKVFAVKLDRKTFDFSHLKGQVVSVDGTDYRVIGVECHMHCAPWWPGEPIGLMVDTVESPEISG